MSERKVALITGISGQDGSYLSEHLIEQGYEVHGMIRRQSTAENQESRLEDISNEVHTYYGDLTDVPSLTRLVTSIDPTHIFNLGAMSHVRISFDIPSYTLQTNAMGVLNLLEVYREFAPEAKYYQASSSEMFGNSFDDDEFQRETTPMNPVSPYGCSKLLGYTLVRHYRNAYKLHACNGILFNHESPRRGSNFVTNKVVKTAVQIKLGLMDKLELGNMDSYRDWGHAKDYTRAMIQIINHETPDDFVVSTGETYSVRDLCEVVFSYLGMDYKDYVTQNPKYIRPEELKYLRGDCSKAKKILGWELEYSFNDMMEEMVDYWMNKFTSTRKVIDV
tara:strand:+ start:77 stop:1078 length:1002 start_codon:yes stop_codon:yes gene_type:complete